MWHFFLLCTLSCCIVLVNALGNSLLGPGQWLVLNILQCEEPEQYEMSFEVSRRKLNRTHDCFTGKVNVPKEVNESYTISIDVYKKMDGGFKFYQTIKDDCLCSFLKRHAKENIERALRMAEIDPPDCPIHAGYYDIEDFVMDYTELPINGIYGTYEVLVFLMHQEETFCCIKVQLHFENYDDDDDDFL